MEISIGGNNYYGTVDSDGCQSLSEYRKSGAVEVVPR